MSINEQLKVSYPADSTYKELTTQVTKNLFNRLNIPSELEDPLINIVNSATDSLIGAGNINFEANWTETKVHITISNPNTKNLIIKTNSEDDLSNKYELHPTENGFRLSLNI